MATVINIQLIVHSTDGVTEYIGPKEDIDRLQDHLKVEGVLPDGLSMVQVSEDAPSDFNSPWMKIDGGRNPVGLFFYNGAEWVDSSPTNSVKSPQKDATIQRGSFQYVASDSGDGTWFDSTSFYKDADDEFSRFKFPHPFLETPTISITMLDCEITQKDGDPGEFCYSLGSIGPDGFSLRFKFGNTLSTADSKIVEFNYIAIGGMNKDELAP